jgi:hypothetical protein
MPLYVAYNGPEPTTAKRVAVTTGTDIKTLLQVATPSTRKIHLIEWGIAFSGAAAATGIPVELIETDVAATVTALTPTKYRGAGDSLSLCVGGTAATGYTATAEGTITAIRTLDALLLQPTANYWHQFPLGREPGIDVSKFLRIRVHAAAAVDAIAYLVWEE